MSEIEFDPQFDIERLRTELADMRAHHDRVVAQRNKDWDALMIEIAKAVGDDDDREAAEMGEIEEFDPWHALRRHASERDRLAARVAELDVEIRTLRNAAVIADEQRDQARAELARLEKHVAHNDEEYVTMKDVLRAEHQECQRLRAELARVMPVYEVFEHGFWQSCSGCHESNEGHPTGPYSVGFRCNIGIGCHECGGIGAVWQQCEYDDTPATKGTP